MQVCAEDALVFLQYWWEHGFLNYMIDIFCGLNYHILEM